MIYVFSKFIYGDLKNYDNQIQNENDFYCIIR